MSQSLVTSRSVTMGHPLVMKMSIFSTKLYGHHQVSKLNMSECFWGSNKAFEIVENLGLDPLASATGFSGKTRSPDPLPNPTELGLSHTPIIQKSTTPDLHRHNSVRVDPYAHSQHIKVLKHSAYI